jgi:hypothetical protein
MPDSTPEHLIELTDADLDMVGGGGSPLIAPHNHFVSQANLPQKVVAQFYTNYYDNGFPVYSE